MRFGRRLGVAAEMGTRADTCVRIVRLLLVVGRLRLKAKVAMLVIEFNSRRWRLMVRAIVIGCLRVRLAVALGVQVLVVLAGQANGT